MNTQEKSLKLAELMGYAAKIEFSSVALENQWGGWTWFYMPYTEGSIGLAQFAQILLKHPEGMLQYVKWHKVKFSGYFTINENTISQTETLDEILRMNGVEI